MAVVRFTQVDPLSMAAASLASPQSLNMYTYVQNDPVNRVDPTGLMDELGAAVGAAQELLKSNLCRIAVGGLKNARNDLSAQLAGIYAAGRITFEAETIRARRLKGGKIIEYTAPFKIGEPGYTWHIAPGEPYHISFDPTQAPWGVPDESIFGIYRNSIADISKLDGSALLVLHEFRHWLGDLSTGDAHLVKFNSLIYSLCFLNNPYWLRNQPINTPPGQVETTVTNRPNPTPMAPGGGAGNSAGIPFWVPSFVGPIGGGNFNVTVTYLGPTGGGGGSVTVSYDEQKAKVL